MYLIGDIHGDFFILKKLLEDIPSTETIIQVGDFGIWPQFAARWKKANIDRDVHFIDGNHDYIPWLDANATTKIEIWPHAFYIPRGLCFPVGDKRVLFLGGSKSVDRSFRRENSVEHGWFESEQLTETQAARAVKAGPVDIIITHTPPDFFIEKNLGREGLKWFDINPKTWIDESARLVEKVWRELGEPPLWAGHIHRSVRSPKVNTLDINEVVKID